MSELVQLAAKVAALHAAPQIGDPQEHLVAFRGAAAQLMRELQTLREGVEDKCFNSAGGAPSNWLARSNWVENVLSKAARAEAQATGLVFTKLFRLKSNETHGWRTSGLVEIVVPWMREHMKGHWRVRDSGLMDVALVDENDMLHFKLRWNDNITAETKVKYTGKLRKWTWGNFEEAES